MDHVWQMNAYDLGPYESDMLEAYSVLNFLAAVTSTVRLHTLVTAVAFRQPGLLAKQVSALDVLSGGRAGLGIGAGASVDESTGLGLPVRPRGNASSCWRRRSRSACRCGRTPMRRSPDDTTSSSGH